MTVTIHGITVTGSEEECQRFIERERTRIPSLVPDVYKLMPSCPSPQHTDFPRNWDGSPVVTAETSGKAAC